MEYLIILIAGIIIGMLLYHIMQEIEEPKTNNEIKQIENEKIIWLTLMLMFSLTKLEICYAQENPSPIATEQVRGAWFDSVEIVEIHRQLTLNQMYRQEIFIQTEKVKEANKKIKKQKVLYWLTIGVSLVFILW